MWSGSDGWLLSFRDGDVYRFVGARDYFLLFLIFLCSSRYKTSGKIICSKSWTIFYEPMIKSKQLRIKTTNKIESDSDFVLYYLVLRYLPVRFLVRTHGTLNMRGWVGRGWLSVIYRWKLLNPCGGYCCMNCCIVVWIITVCDSSVYLCWFC